MHLERLQEQWQAYIDIPSDIKSSEAKLIELKKFLRILRADNIDEISSFFRDDNCLSRVCGDLIGEFQVDLLRVSNESLENDLSKLLDYLSNGRGSVLLQVLSIIGIAEMVDHQRLGNIALWAFKLCLKMVLPTSCYADIQPTENHAFFAGILEDFRYLSNKSVQQSAAVQLHPCSLSPESPTDSDTSSRRCRLRARRRRQLLKIISLAADTDSEDDVAIKILKPKMRRRSTIPDLADCSGTKMSVEDELHDESCFKLTLPDVLLHLLSLLKNIVQVDVQRAGETTACMYLAPIVGTTLCSIVSSLCVGTENARSYPSYSDSLLFVLSRCLTRLFFVMLLRIGEHTNGLTMLRRCSAVTDAVKMVDEKAELLCRTADGERFVYDFTVACWLYAKGLLILHHRNVVVINATSKNIELVTRGHGYNLTSFVLVRFSSMVTCAGSDNFLEVNNLIEAIAEVSRLLKTMRAFYIHMCTCMQRSHRTCISTLMKSRHHHDVLGSPLSSTYSADDTCDDIGGLTADACVLSMICVLLLQVYRRTKSCRFRQNLLGVLESNTVVCCCVPPAILIGSLRSDVELSTPDGEVRLHNVSLLVDILVAHCGAGLMTDCCVLCNDGTLEWREDVKGEGMYSSDSALSGCDGGSTLSSVFRWSCISDVLGMLQSSDPAFARYVLSQMLRLVVGGSKFLRFQLYKTLYFPVFRSMVAVLLPLEDCSSSITMGQINGSVFAEDALSAVRVCLCAFRTLLQDSTARSHFISNGYVSIVYALSNTVSVRYNCLSLLEVLTTLTDGNIPLSSKAKDLGDNETPAGGSALDLFINSLLKNRNDKDEEHHSSVGLVNFDEISRLSDWWSFASRLFSKCPSFCLEFVRRKGHLSARALLISACRSFLRLKVNLSTDNVQSAMYRSCVEGNVSTANDTLRLIHSCFFICLNCKVMAVDFDAEDLLIDELISELVQVVRGGVTFDCFQLFCEMMLVCVQQTECSLNSLECCCWLSEASEDHSCDKDRPRQTVLLYSNLAEQNVSEEMADYDADKEFSSDCCQGLSALVFQISLLDPEYATDKKLQAEKSSKEATSGNVVVHPHLCRLVLQLTAVCRGPEEAALSPDVVATIMFWLVSLVRKSSVTAVSLHQQGVAHILLTSFREGFLQSDLSTSTIQRSVLELYLLITHSGASMADLKHLLQLFNEDHAPQDMLLLTLISLFNSLPLQATYSLPLPTSCSSLSNNTLPSCASDDGSTNTIVADQSMLTTTIRQSQQAATNLTTPPSDLTPLPMSSSAIACAPLSTNWKMGSLWPNQSSSSFSLSMWLLVEDIVQAEVSKQKLLSRQLSCTSTDHEFSTETSKSSSKGSNGQSSGSKRLKWSDSFIHLVSIGSAELLFEIWVDRSSSYLVARIMTLEAGSLTIHCQSRITGRLGQGRWHHISLAYSEALGVDGTEVMVVTFVDGISQMSTTMDYKMRSRVTKVDNVFYLGHSLPASKEAVKSGFCQLGNLFLFNDFQMNLHTSCYLFALGPDCCTLAECDSSEQTVVYVKHICRALVRSSDVVHELLGSLTHPYIDNLKSSVVLMYTPRNPMTLNIFEQPPVSGPSSSGSTLSPSIAVFSLPLRVHLDCIERSVNRGTMFSVRQLGGIRVFIFLFAKVVERRRCEVEQANALRLVFTLIHRDIQLAREFAEADGYEMIAKVFITNRCIMGYEILKVLTDSCVTCALMQYSSSTLRYAINKENVALISDVKIIVEMLLSWRAWEKSADGVYLMALQALNSLVRTDHPHRQYNIEQYRRAGLVSKLLEICKERLQDSRPSYSLSICNAVLSLLRSTIGNQLVIHNVISICDFLLLMHPAASTFAEQNKTRFWFRNKWIVSTGGAQLMDSITPRLTEHRQTLLHTTKTFCRI